MRNPFKRRKDYGQISVIKLKNGQIVVKAAGRVYLLEARAKTPDEKMEMVKSVVLAEGFVWTAKLEREIEKIVFIRP